eukprot:TRINITY_DN41782_c0_g1_i1.p1 TRINITY_DN41782_c0_g1~~TRINITY_DN41782_c0_g1_i1.p1  ORF type:complete len:438 (+),score=49.94 TRINITY_DN41782_c0_g1_i1:266-1579(+)
MEMYACTLIFLLSSLWTGFSFEYVGLYPGNPANRPVQKGCTTGLLFQNAIQRQFVLVAYQNGAKMSLAQHQVPTSVDYALLTFTGFDRTPDGMLGDTSQSDATGELSNTQPLFAQLSRDNRTVLVLSLSNCATGPDAPCAANTTSAGSVCERSWNEVITKSYNHLKGNKSAPLCSMPRKGCDAPSGPFQCANYAYPTRAVGTPEYCTYEYSCADDTQMVSDALDWLTRQVGEAAPKFLLGFSNGAQFSMSVACDARIVDKVDGVISQHGSPSGNYCCWDNPNSDMSKKSRKLAGFLHIGGQQGIDTALPTFCDTETLGYCDCGGYKYSSARSNLQCWNDTLALEAQIEHCEVALDSGAPFNRLVDPSMDLGHTTCLQLHGQSLVACRSNMDHHWDAFFTTLMAHFVEHIAQGEAFDLHMYGKCAPEREGAPRNRMYI